MLEHMLSKIPCGSPSTNSNLQLLIDSFFHLSSETAHEVILKRKKQTKNKQKTNHFQNSMNYVQSQNKMKRITSSPLVQ